MTCSYCGSRNSDTEHRCRRCGRRPGDSLNNEFAVHRTNGALATQPRLAEVADRPAEARPQQDWTGAVQGTLFTQNVIAMPRRTTTPRNAPRPRNTAATSVAGVKPAVKRPPRPRVEGQGELDFVAPAQNKPKTLGTTVDAVIYCEAPVATPMHRATAAIIDWTAVLIAYGLFLLTFVMCHGEIAVTKSNLLIYGGALAVVAAAYGLCWTIAGTETFGMHCTHLRVITFDGFPPDMRQRLARMAGTCLSLFSVLGILWCLADEEGLGWQDHMSRTFPTAHELESRVFRRR